MTDETYVRIVEFTRRNAVPGLGRIGEIPIYVDDSVPDDEPEMSEHPYAVGIRMSRADHADLRRRMDELEKENL